MAKKKTGFFCKECGYESSKWLGQCPMCKNWDVFVEEPVAKSTGTGVRISQVAEKPLALQEVSSLEEERISTDIEELDRVLGGGIVVGSLVLVGGDPGIGKSTLLLQMCKALADKKRNVLYISGEESLKQIKLRAERLGKNWDKLLALSETNLDLIEATILEVPHKNTLLIKKLKDIDMDTYKETETNIDNVLSQVEKLSPKVVIIDSIQTMFKEEVSATPGSVTQVREATSVLLRIAKGMNIAIFIVGHVTKEGVVAGPRMLEHMVDTVLYFEGERNQSYRILRAIKNRFGNTSEMGIFEMRQEGLREVSNPSELLLTQNNDGMSGIAIASAIEGVRPLLIEVQALASTAAYGTPQRSATGFDLRRLNMLLAVLEKRAGFKLAQKDVFLNIAGGLKINDPAIDLAVISAILSSNLDIEIPKGFCMAGEVGLSGEIRPVNRIEQRIAEAEKLGFEKMILPEHNFSSLTKNNYKIKLLPVKKTEEAFKILFT